MTAPPPSNGQVPSPADLSILALERAAAHAALEWSGELHIEARDPTVEFDDAHLRQVFEQVMVIWRRMGDFEILLDGEDRPVGFQDLAETDACRWTEISASDILGLATASGWLRGAVVADGLVERLSNGAARLLVHDPDRPEGTDRVELLVNPIARKLFAVRPVGGDDAGT